MGKLIVIEGLDGSGKATQAALLGARLEKRGVPHRLLSFPDYARASSAPVKMYLSGELGELKDISPYGASLFYAVDRYASYLQSWRQDYEKGTLMLCDRYATSNVAHQMSRLPRGDWDDYLAWLDDLEYVRVGIPRPDAVVYLDMAPETSRALLSGRYGGDESRRDLHERDLAYLLECREAALYGARKLGWRVIACCDGEKPLPKETVAEKIINALGDDIQ